MHWINIENKCVFANTVCLQLSVTNDSHLPQDMILLNCLFSIYLFFFLQHTSGTIDKGQLDYQVFSMTAIYFSLTSCNCNAAPCMAKGKCMFAREMSRTKSMLWLASIKYVL